MIGLSTVDLMLLGALMEHPMNAYEMKKRMENASVKNWAKISSPAIYRNLISLHKRGYLNAEVVKDSQMPEKTIYTVNIKGKEHFRRLMENYSENPGTVYLNLTVFIDNLKRLDKQDAEKMLATLKDKLYAQREYMKLVLKQHGGSSCEAKAIIGLYVQLYDMLYSWCKDFFKEKYN